MGETQFGIIGTGMIAGVIAQAITRSTSARLAAVSSRSLTNAQTFLSKHNLTSASAVEGVESLLARADVQSVYIATPTAAREAITLAAIRAKKHVLVEKPFTSADSVRRLIAAAKEHNVLFMDATHLTHHPRTSAILAATKSRIGIPRSLHTVFCFPFSDRANIRFDPNQEPMGALGDLAWYGARAIVEYLRPAAPISKISVAPEFDPSTNVLIRASGHIAFSTGEDSTFYTGYAYGAALMDLELLGTAGAISMDDFVLDWTNSWAFQNPDLKTGYSWRVTGSRKDRQFIETPNHIPQEIRMIDAFAAATSHSAQNASFGHTTLQTQLILDAMWAACQ